MFLIVECTAPKLTICLAAQGLHRLLVFNEMDEPTALRLLPQYGYRPGQVRGMEHVRLPYRRQLSDAKVAELLQRQATLHPGQRTGQLLQAVRLYLPEAERIVCHQ